MTEIWRAIPGFPGYEVSNLGRICSFKRDIPRVLRPSSNRRGYRGVNLVCDGQVHYRRVARLVLLAFRGSPPSGMEVCHNDGDSSNDCLSNLRYDTHANNMLDAVRQDRIRGSLTNLQARAIRVKFARGASVAELTREYPISKSTVRCLLLGKTYQDAGGPIARGPLYRLRDNDVRRIRQLVAVGIMQKRVAVEYGVTESMVSLIVRGKRRVSAGIAT